MREYNAVVFDMSSALCFEAYKNTQFIEHICLEAFFIVVLR